MTVNGSGQVDERIELLQLAGAGHREQPLHGALAVVTAIAEHDFAPLDGGSQRAFRDVIRRLDAVLMNEREEVLMMDEERTGEIADVTGGGIDVAFAQGKERFLKRQCFRDQLVAGEGPPRTCGSPR